MAFVQIFTGTVTHNTTSSPTTAYQLPPGNHTNAVSILSAFAVTAGTTGCQLLMAYSIDGGATYTDYAAIGSTAPTPSSGTPVSSQIAVPLDTYKTATHLQFKIKNLDATNDATVTLNIRSIS